jgi:ubiquinone/menaquinone biosynthesis C-methylase UbiE
MLPRILEPELMDSNEDAREYDAMDHSVVNTVFVSDLLNVVTNWSLQWPAAPGSQNLEVLDLGAGTAQIPIVLARRAPHIHITAADAAQHMLALAQKNIAAAELTNRIALVHSDAKKLTFDDASFPVVISNSIVHHIPDPRACLAEAVRVTAPGGLLFHRDLARPTSELRLNELVNTYAANDTPYQRRLFAESLQAALSLDEVQQLVADFGFAPDTVQMTSDRHWTWVARKL